MLNRNIKKLYYSIGEVSDIVGVKQYVLRYWESEFSALSPSKNRAGNRVYREKDILLIKFIKHLLYDKKFTIEGAKQKLKEITPEDIQNFAQEGELTVETSSSGGNEKYINIIRDIKTGLQEMLELLNNWE